MLLFKPISGFQPGDLFQIIYQSYTKLIEKNRKCWGGEIPKWKDFDRQAFGKPPMAKCVFVTCLNKKPIGLASFDPRNKPKFGIIGQNCILPSYQGKGYGSKQILKILKVFKKRGIRSARVTTSEHPFFTPALKMYQQLGFKEVRRKKGGSDPKYKIIELEKNLK